MGWGEKVERRALWDRSWHSGVRIWFFLGVGWLDAVATAEDGTGLWTKTTIDDFDRQSSCIHAVFTHKRASKKVRPLTAYIYESIPAACGHLPTYRCFVVDKRDKSSSFR